MTDLYRPKPEHKFTFGLWTVGNPGPIAPRISRASKTSHVAVCAATSSNKEKARRWNEDKEIQALIREVGAAPTDGLPSVDAYSRTAAESLKAASWIDETIAFYRNEEILK